MDRRQNFTDPVNRELREGIGKLKDLRLNPETDRLAEGNYPAHLRRVMLVTDGVTLTAATLAMQNGDWATPGAAIGINLILKMGLTGLIRRHIQR